MVASCPLRVMRKSSANKRCAFAVLFDSCTTTTCDAQVRELARNDREENIPEAHNMAHIIYQEYRVRRYESASCCCDDSLSQIPSDVEAILATARTQCESVTSCVFIVIIS
jgi:hypothetical protein